MIKIYKSQEVSDGAGVKLNRIIGSNKIDNANPFYLLDEFRSDNKDSYIAGFPMHPHRGIETITYMVEGSFTHRDSKGNHGVLKSGEVQWMSAGKGILHEEMPAMEEGQLWGYQLWVNLPAKYKMAEPTYRHIKAEDIPIIKEEGLEVKVISGTFDKVEGPIKSYFPVDYMDVKLKGGSFEKELRITNVIYVHTGSIIIFDADAKQEINSGNMILIEDVSKVKITGENSGFLFISSNPINEPVARYGPFIMNTTDELLQAFDDYNNGILDK